MLMSQIIIGLVGPIASGKGLLAEHLKLNNFKIFSLSDKVREEARARGMEIKRETLQNIGDDLRIKYGNQILAERVAFDLIGESGNLVVDSIRNPGEIIYLKERFDLQIIGVNAQPQLRARYYMQRAKERGEDTADLDHFLKSALRDLGIGQGEHGQQVDACLGLADVIFQNNGTKNELTRELDKFMKEKYGFDPEIHRSSKEK